MVSPAAGRRRIGEWTCLDPSACFGVSLFRHETYLIMTYLIVTSKFRFKLYGF